MTSNIFLHSHNLCGYVEHIHNYNYFTPFHSLSTYLLNMCDALAKYLRFTLMTQSCTDDGWTYIEHLKHLDEGILIHKQANNTFKLYLSRGSDYRIVSTPEWPTVGRDAKDMEAVIQVLKDHNETVWGGDVAPAPAPAPALRRSTRLAM